MSGIVIFFYSWEQSVHYWSKDLALNTHQFKRQWEGEHVDVNVASTPECWGPFLCCTLDLLSPPSGMEKKGPMVRDSPGQWAGNVSLLDFLGACWWLLLLCKHQLDGCCSPLLGCGSGEYVIPIFWKGKLRMKNQRKPLEASAIGAQEPYNVKCTFISSLAWYVWCWSCFSSWSQGSVSKQKVGCPWPGQQPLPNVVTYIKELAWSFVGCQG